MDLHIRHIRVRQAETKFAELVADWWKNSGVTDAEGYMIVTGWLHRDMQLHVKYERQELPDEE